MPVKPQPMKLICRTCGATRIYSPASDCMITPMPRCDRCYDQNWDVTALSRLDRLNPLWILQGLLK